MFKLAIFNKFVGMPVEGYKEEIMFSFNKLAISILHLDWVVDFLFQF